MKKQDVKVQGLKTEEGINELTYIDIQSMTVKISDYIDVSDVYELGVYLQFTFSNPPESGNVIIDFYEFDNNTYSILPNNQFYRQSFSFNQETSNVFFFTLKVDVNTQRYIKMKISNTTEKMINEVKLKFISSLI